MTIAALLVTTGRRVWVNLYGHTSPGEFEMANTDVLADVDDAGIGLMLSWYDRGVMVHMKDGLLRIIGGSALVGGAGVRRRSSPATFTCRQRSGGPTRRTGGGGVFT
jgi:hypothetical protein